MNNLPKFIRDILDFINKDSETLSLLYDLDLMPEQLEEKSSDWYKMLIIADFIKKGKEKLSETTRKDLQ